LTSHSFFETIEFSYLATFPRGIWGRQMIVQKAIYRTIVICASSAVFLPQAHASLLFNFSVSPSSIITGSTATLDLQITNGPPTHGGGVSPDAITGADLTFNSGDGQSFHLVTPVGSHDYQHQFTYLTPGLFSPEVTGLVSGVEFTAVSVIPYSQSLDLTSSLQVNSPTAAVPEPSTWAMMLLGFCGLGCLAYRRKSKAVLAA